MPEHPPQPRKIAIVGYTGVQSLDLTGPYEVFAMANRFRGDAYYEPILASPAGGMINCNSGLQLAGAIALAELPSDLDTILFGGGTEEGLLSMRDGPVLEWLNDRKTSTRRIGSV